MPDYNPDKERHRDHKWIVHKAVRDRDFLGVVAGGKEMRFNREERFSVSDESIAAEIREDHPHTVAVTRVNNPKPADRGHKYFFGLWPEMPWKRSKQV
jgi:hypothetical protein